MTRWALVVGLTAVGLLISAWQHDDIDGRRIIFDDEFVDRNDQRIDSDAVSTLNSTSSNGLGPRSINRRNNAQSGSQRRIWREIQQEVREMRNNILPVLADNISYMQMDFKDMDRNFFHVIKDVELIKADIQYIKHQAHVIWENVTDVRRDHKRISRTLWTVVSNVTFIVYEMNRLSRYMIEVQRNYGTLNERLEYTANKVTEISEFGNAINNVNGEFDQMRATLDSGTSMMTGEIRVVRDTMGQLTQTIYDIKDYVSSGFLQILHDNSMNQYAVVANISDLASKIVNQAMTIALTNERVLEVATQLYLYMEKSKEVWDRVVRMSDFLNDLGESIINIDRHMGYLVDSIRAVDVRTVDMHIRANDMSNQMKMVTSNVVDMRADLNGVKHQLEALEKTIRSKYGEGLDNDNSGVPSVQSGPASSSHPAITSTTTVYNMPELSSTSKPWEPIPTAQTLPPRPLPSIPPQLPAVAPPLEYPMPPSDIRPYPPGFIPQPIQPGYPSYPGLHPPQPGFPSSPGYPSIPHFPGLPQRPVEQIPGLTPGSLPNIGATSPIVLPIGPLGPGLSIGCGDRSTGYCVCACPCQCGCPSVDPGIPILSTTTESGRFFQNGSWQYNPDVKNECQCLCVCPCPAEGPGLGGQVPPIPSLPLFPPASLPSLLPTAGGLSPDYIPWADHVPAIPFPHLPSPPGWLPQAENPRHLDLLNDLVKRSATVQSTLQRMETDEKAEHESTRHTIIDNMNKAFGFLLQDSRTHLSKIIQIITQTLSTVRALQTQLRDAMERAGHALQTIATNILQFHREMSASHVTAHYFPPIGGRPGFSPIVVWPHAQSQGLQSSEVVPGGQSPAHAPSIAGTHQPGSTGHFVHGLQQAFPQYVYVTGPSMLVPPGNQHGVKLSGDPMENSNRNESTAIFNVPGSGHDLLHHGGIDHTKPSSTTPTSTGTMAQHRRLLTRRIGLDDEGKVIGGDTDQSNDEEEINKGGEEWMLEKDHGDTRRYSPWLLPANKLFHIGHPFVTESYDQYLRESFSHVGDPGRSVRGRSASEVALLDEQISKIDSSIGPLTFHDFLQQRIVNKFLNAIQPRLVNEVTGRLFPLGRSNKRTRNPFMPRLRANLTRSLSDRPPVRLSPFIPTVGFPHQLALRPPPIPTLTGGRLPPGSVLPGAGGLPYSLSYTDGRGNSWNVNVNRRHNAGVERGPDIKDTTDKKKVDKSVETENQFSDRDQNKRQGWEEK